MKTLSNISYPALVLCAFSCFALSPEARAVCQEGCPGVGKSNTALGWDALINVEQGLGQTNTAIGYNSMFTLVNGQSNTAVGYNSLYFNTDGGNNTAVGFDALFTNT